MLGCIFRAAFFLNWQGIHVRPEGDGFFRAEVEEGTEASLRGTAQFAAQTFQLAPQIADGFRKLAVQLRDLVQCPTVFYGPNGKCPLSVDDCFPIIDEIVGCVNFYLAFLLKE